MKTKAVRLYGAMDLRTEEFDLPVITEGEILLRVVTDSLCTSTYKAVRQGTEHKRVPPDVNENPIIIGHEMCGEIVQVGERRSVVRGGGAVSAGTRAATLILREGETPHYENHHADAQSRV